MIAIEPYSAERRRYFKNDHGGMDPSWEPCRVIGVTKDEDGELAYIVEVYAGSERWLETEAFVRRAG
jgi:hypothetical protein